MVKGLLEQLISAQMRRDSMTLGPVAVPVGNPDVQRLDALIASTRANLTTAVRNQLEALRAQLASTDQMRSASGQQMERLPVEEAQEVRLNLQFETVRNISDRLREEYQKARMAEVVEAGQVEVLDLADTPDQPLPTNRTLKVLMGLLAGLLLGTGGAFLIEHVNTTVRSRDELEALLDLPALAVIPRITGDPARVGRLRALLGRGRHAGDPQDAAGAAHLEHAGGGEAFRTLRTNLMFSQATGALRSLVVASSAPGEGKSTTASNLAISFAQQGLRVVLLDADLRRARLHRVFGVDREPGLTQWVLGMCTMDQVLRPTTIDGLTLVPSGALPPNPAELLGGDRMARVLRELEDHFDMIILDTPPLLAASDAAVLAARADGVLLVVRAGSTDRTAVVQVTQQLDTVDSRIIGTVLNDLDGKLPRYGGYDYYRATA
ncbi:MAG: polysaccharide biosynthesis tyrosine autokinase [Gemmatimonadetes bacterium]|nr:polysaccharide biosynthesis tyrosine autokinase [Gemmatimonadota bacterium]